jgi:hypothetical protein
MDKLKSNNLYRNMKICKFHGDSLRKSAVIASGEGLEVNEEG